MASVAEHQLKRLPLELVQKIAVLCPLGDFLALSRTCRYLYIVCTSAVALRQYFPDNMIRPTAHSGTSIRELIRASLASKHEALAKPMTLSLDAATSHLPSLIEELQTLLEPYESVPWDYSWDSSLPEPGRLPQAGKTIIGALSTLTVLGCDFTVPAALTGLAARLFEPDFWSNLEPHASSRVSLASQIAFCLATGVLGGRVLNNMPLLSFRLASLFDRPNYSPPLYEDLGGSFEGPQAIYLLVIACLPWVLESDPYVRIHVRDQLPSLAAVPLLASAFKSGVVPLPDGEVGTVPSPGDEGSGHEVDAVSATRCLRRFALAPSWLSWLRDNVDMLIDEMGSGEWVGYYTNTLGRESEVDQPMRSIYFDARPVPGDNGAVDLTAENCADGVGTFRLQGRVERLTGLVLLDKEYAVGDPWRVTGRITPLGIAGTWGFGEDRASGFMWMYKREWTRSGGEGGRLGGLAS